MAETATSPAVHAALSDTEKPQWWSMRSKKSEAMPRHSLFGTALEQVDRDHLKDIQGRYIPEGYIRPDIDRYPLPQHLKARIPGRDALESSRQELRTQKSLLTEADRQLKSKAENALSFNETGLRSARSSQSRSSKPSWLSEKDLEHSKEINIVGLNPKGSYNRDKYAPKPPRHNYSLIGDILGKSNEFNTPRELPGNSEAYKRNRNTGYGTGRHLPYDLMAESQSTKNKPSQSLINLPPNIRHTFGSRVCDTLLSDKELVNLSIERQKSKSGPPRPSKKENVEGLPVNLEDTYESLGQTTRYNVFPGLTTGHKISQTQKEFNDEVHLRRVPNPDEYRYQRDELSIWVEQDVLRKRMEDRWKTYFETLPKLAVNWDRGGKRPVIVAAKSAPNPRNKPKPKPKSRQAPAPAQQEKEDEIIFVTPPLTPPPPPEEKIELPKEFKRDDEFWQFFDQALPR